MKKIFIISMLLCLNSVIALPNSRLDSVYCAMYNVAKFYHNIDEELLENETCRDKLYIEDLSDTLTVFLQEVNIENIKEMSDTFTVVLKNINLKRVFSIYRFDYIGIEHSNMFILIKLYSDFFIFDGTDINRIVIKLKEIKKEHPNLISNTMFVNYLDKIVIYYRLHNLILPIDSNIYYYFDSNNWKKWKEFKK